MTGSRRKEKKTKNESDQGHEIDPAQGQDRLDHPDQDLRLDVIDIIARVRV